MTNENEPDAMTAKNFSQRKVKTNDHPRTVRMGRKKQCS